MNTTYPTTSAEPVYSEMMMARLQWHEAIPDTTVLTGERRRSRRLMLVETPVSIWAPSHAGAGPHVETTIVDVSQDGLGVLGPAPIPVGTVVAVQSIAGFAVGSVRRCEPLAGGYRWGIALESCVATRATVEQLIRLARKLESAQK
jgi:hypothetical protein